MRLPTEQERDYLCQLNARIRADLAKAAPAMAATMREMVLAFYGTSRRDAKASHA